MSLLLFLGAGGKAVTTIVGTGNINIDAPAIVAAGVVVGGITPHPPSGIARVSGEAGRRARTIRGKGGVIVEAPAIYGFGMVWENEDWLFDLPSEDERLN